MSWSRIIFISRSRRPTESGRRHEIVSRHLHQPLQPAHKLSGHLFAGRYKSLIPRTDEECHVWNRFVAKLGWRDERSHVLPQRIQESGLTGKPIETLIDHIEFDEGHDLVAARAWATQPSARRSSPARDQRLPWPQRMCWPANWHNQAAHPNKRSSAMKSGCILLHARQAGGGEEICRVVYAADPVGTFPAKPGYEGIRHSFPPKIADGKQPAQPSPPRLFRNGALTGADSSIAEELRNSFTEWSGKI